MLKSAFFTLSCLLLMEAARADAIRLQIVGPDKKPVAGAKVRVLEYSAFRPDGKAAAPRDFTSDANGKIAFASKKPLVSRPTNARNVAEMRGAHTVFVRVVAPGMAITAQALRAGDNQIVLQKGIRFGGVALDEAGKPAAGVKIELEGIDAASGAADDAATDAKSFGFPGALQPSTISNAQGKWSFEAMPPRGVARIHLASPRFVRESLRLSLGPDGAPPLFLERAAIIRGQLLKPDGTPAAGVSLSAIGEGDYELRDDFHTGADGRFELNGLRAGDFSVQRMSFGTNPPLPFLLSTKRVQALKVGEIRNIGVWKAQNGVLVKGKVVVVGTQKPIEGAWILIYGGGSGNGATDANGTFSVRSATSNERLNINARGFVPIFRPLPKASKNLVDLGTIELTPGIAAQGTVKDKNGRGVPNLQVYVQSPTGNRSYGSTDDAGAFVFDDLEPGTTQLRVEGAKLLGEVPVTAARDRKTPPIQAVVEVVYGPEPAQILIGRALDGKGKPVAGAKITLKFRRDNSWSSATTLSGVDGTFEAPVRMKGATPGVVSARRPGFTFARGGDFKVVDGVWRGDLQFQPAGAVLRGRVVDSAGRSLARVWVSSAGRADAPTVESDAQGAFSLPGTALEGAVLAVSDGHFFGEIRPAADGTVALPTFQAPPVDGAALANSLLPDADFEQISRGDAGAVWDVLGAARLEAAIGRFQFGGENWQWRWSELLRQLARLDPKRFVARGEELLALSPEPDARLDALLATLRARSDDAAQRERAQKWLETKGEQSLAISAETVTQLLRMASVAHALQAGTGGKWVEFAAQIAAQLGDQTRVTNAQEWGRRAAAIGMPAFENLILDWGANSKLNAFNGALDRFYASNDLPQARAMLARMEAIFPAAKTSKDQLFYQNYLQKPQDKMVDARGDFAQLLARTDPQAALRLLKTASNYRQTELLIEIAKSAARLNQKPLAVRALREILGSKAAPVDTLIEAAQAAQDFDPQLADELFARARPNLTPRRDEEMGYQPATDAYALARAKNHPGESRILLEREWQSRLKAYRVPADNYFVDERAATLARIIGAMAHLDARRALEMVELLPAQPKLRAQARGRIVLALLGK